MIVEIISTGTELLLGEIEDTNAQYLSIRLNELGYYVYYRTTVGDNRVRMLEALEIASKRADIVITSGGLGPTAGDITKEVTAEFCKQEMVLDGKSLQKINDIFAKRKAKMSNNNEKQAMFAKNALILTNNYGTAPGMIVKYNETIFINLPGPPRELKGMFEDEVVPYLQTSYGSMGTIYSQSLRSIGLGESNVAEILQDIIQEQVNPTIALYARDGEILIRVTAKAVNSSVAQKIVNEMVEKISQRLDKNIYGNTEKSLQAMVGEELLKNGLTIAAAESCTGGMLSSMLTDVPGSSEYLLGSVVSYSNGIKEKFLGVSELTLGQYGAVSENVAIEMAEGVQKRMNVDVGVGITGIAGPGGASEAKPIGLVYIAVTYKQKTICKKYYFSGDRDLVRKRCSKSALVDILNIIKK